MAAPRQTADDPDPAARAGQGRAAESRGSVAHGVRTRAVRPQAALCPPARSAAPGGGFEMGGRIDSRGSALRGSLARVAFSENIPLAEASRTKDASARRDENRRDDLGASRRREKGKGLLRDQPAPKV